MIRGPRRTEIMLDYRNADTGRALRVSRINIYGARAIAELVSLELVWKD